VRIVFLLAAICLPAVVAHAQSGRVKPPLDLRPLSVTQTITVEEFDKGRVVKSRTFV
jgi:hypothetical protein